MTRRMGQAGRLQDATVIRRQAAEQAARLAAQMTDPDKALPGHIRTRAGQRRLPEQEPAADAADAVTERPAPAGEDAVPARTVVQVSSTRRTRVRRGATAQG
ncbi:hypothetical protein H7J08_07870 [Mycobacterium frederiksbergense]|uniref:hypothetical protein n=1 Tax=Mycolicibacterium frederiksbergense TaxID=117567 RepID=UPI0021F33102|nr:hypothetical protein [Mycolicibacterium frederiksbergense]MCV7044589.1 hypothetical protein [Mycolicibacterium frederiksbergense]